MALLLTLRCDVCNALAPSTELDLDLEFSAGLHKAVAQHFLGGWRSALDSNLRPHVVCPKCAPLAVVLQ